MHSITRSFHGTLAVRHVLTSNYARSFRTTNETSFHYYSLIQCTIQAKAIMSRTTQTKTMTFLTGVYGSDITTWLNSTAEVCHLSNFSLPDSDDDDLYLFDIEAFLTKPDRVSLKVQYYRELGPLPIPLMTINACVIIDDSVVQAFHAENHPPLRNETILIVNGFENMEYLEVEVTLSYVC